MKKSQDCFIFSHLWPSLRGLILISRSLTALGYYSCGTGLKLQCREERWKGRVRVNWCRPQYICTWYVLCNKPDHRDGRFMRQAVLKWEAWKSLFSATFPLNTSRHCKLISLPDIRLLYWQICGAIRINKCDYSKGLCAPLKGQCMSWDNLVEAHLRGSSADLKLTVLLKLYDKPVALTVLFS